MLNFKSAYHTPFTRDSNATGVGWICIRPNFGIKKHHTVHQNMDQWRNQYDGKGEIRLGYHHKVQYHILSS